MPLHRIRWHNPSTFPPTDRNDPGSRIDHFPGVSLSDRRLLTMSLDERSLNSSEVDPHSRRR